MTESMPALLTCLSLVMYVAFALNVGRARGKYKIAAPATTGHPHFERIFRVQQNTLEHLAIFLPSMWLFTSYVSIGWASVLGAVWIAARIWYGIEYAREGGKRGPGFGLSFAAVAILLVGAIIGIIAAMARS